MTIKALMAQARYLKLLRGEKCVGAGVGYASALLLDFTMLHPPDATGYRQPDKGLVVECPWRLETKTEVLAAWGDADEAIKSAIQVCVGRSLLRYWVYRPSYMVRLEFEGQLCLWIFPDRAKDYAAESEYPDSPWYIAGRAIPDESWEKFRSVDDATRQ